MSTSPTFQLFTSIRYDPLLLTSSENSRPDLNFITPSPFYMLAYHRDRMVEAAQHFDFDRVTLALVDGPALHKELLKRVKEWQAEQGKGDGPLKLRILFDNSANMTVDFLSIPAVPLSTLYPPSLDPPNAAPQTHPAKKKPFQPSPLTGGALNLGPTDSLPAGDSSQSAQPPQPKQFQPSPLTSGALTLGPGVTLPAGNQDPNYHPPDPAAVPADAPPIAPPPEWTLRLDTSPTPSSPHTLLKTTQRAAYDASRARALPDNPASAVHRDAVLFNELRRVTEGTLTSLYFFRAGRWVTPPVGLPSAFKTSASSATNSSATKSNEASATSKVGAGGQRGTTRRWALGAGLCIEETVDVATVEVGEGVWVSNGVRGFGFGRVVG